MQVKITTANPNPTNVFFLKMEVATNTGKNRRISTFHLTVYDIVEKTSTRRASPVMLNDAGKVGRRSTTVDDREPPRRTTERRFGGESLESSSKKVTMRQPWLL